MELVSTNVIVVFGNIFLRWIHDASFPRFGRVESSHSRDYFSRAYLAPVSLAMHWFVFSALGTHPLFPILNFYLLPKECLSYLTHVSNIIVLVDLLP